MVVDAYELTSKLKRPCPRKSWRALQQWQEKSDEILPRLGSEKLMQYARMCVLGGLCSLKLYIITPFSEPAVCQQPAAEDDTIADVRHHCFKF